MKFPILGYIDLVSNIVPLAAGIRCRRLLESEMRLFLLFVLIAAVTESTASVLSHLNVVNWWMLNVYTILEYVLVIWVLSHWQRERMKTALQVSIVVFGIVWIVSKFTIEDFHSPDTYTQTISSTLVLAASTISLLRLTPPNGSTMLRDIRFWVTGGLLLYSAGNLTAALLLDKVVSLKFPDAMIVYQLHWALNILVNLMYTFGFLSVRE